MSDIISSAGSVVDNNIYFGGNLDEVVVTAKKPESVHDVIPGLKSKLPDLNDQCNLPEALRSKMGGNKLLIKSEHDAPSGFYYDQQIQNRALTMTLHPNRVPTDKTGIAQWEGPEDPDSETDTKFGYDKEPIAIALAQEDFQVGIHNEWSDGGGMDDISGFFNSVKGYAPFVGEVGNKASEAAKRGQEVADEARANGEVVAPNLNDFMAWIGRNSHRLEEVMNRALVVQGTRFSYYNGTGVAFGNMTMKVMYFSDWNPKTGKWESCYDKLNKLVPYMIGPYKQWDEGQKPDEGWNKFIGWQLPPGDFRADLKTVDTVQQGTLQLRFANLYSISNLVIQDAQINFSRNMVKVANSSNVNKIDVSPLYCEVNLTLKPAAKYTGQKFIESITGEKIKSNKTNYVKEVNTRLTNLNKI